MQNFDYDVIIVGAGPGGIFSAYELTKEDRGLKIAVFEAGHPLAKRRCPIDGERVKSCIKCQTCSIMSGFGGAGAFSDREVQHHERLRWHAPRAHRQERRRSS